MTARALCPASRAAGREETASTSLIAVALDFWGFRSSFSGAVAKGRLVVRHQQVCAEAGARPR